MIKIDNYNCEGLCQEKYCALPYTHCETIRSHGLLILISLCEKHAEMWDNNIKEDDGDGFK